ncbi:MAG TPA: dual specificity protein phosphatase family protein [Pyrinomonadaceae bacterium]
MKGPRFSKLSLPVAALLLSVTVAATQSASQERLLPRFHQVNEHLYRGAQPRVGGIRRLAELKIKTIINLRNGTEDAGAEAEEARRAHINYFNVPLPGFGRPGDEQVEKVLAIINDSRNWPVFVHCNHGQDRTGLIIAVYRISHDGWTLEQAMKEAKHYGLSRFQFRMKDYIKDYARDH